MQLSVLDVAGRVDETYELATLADALGYARYWIAEHSPQPTPILVTAIVAGLTERIRVGTAGILFHYYPAQRTAHDFQFLAHAYHDRIDAGFCGGMASTLDPAELDGRDPASLAPAYPERVARLVRHLRNTPLNPAYDPTTAWGGATVPPEIWSLGGGARSAELAARHGLRFGYSLLYNNSVDDPEAGQRYRDRFVPAFPGDQPRLAVAVCGICADTDAAAVAIADRLTAKFFKPAIVGSPATCAAALRELEQRYGADDIVFADLCLELDARKRGYELLAEALIGAAR